MAVIRPAVPVAAVAVDQAEALEAAVAVVAPVAVPAVAVLVMVAAGHSLTSCCLLSRCLPDYAAVVLFEPAPIRYPAPP